ncbi:mitochondrial import inner membrane translocase subunit Tim54 [Massariosphaeria phaeospora]|uniref:Mitochondrial import inner membrane translocase subunit TIM54 n=1 Tax=Massariosphaeria phaeospora TaxID=100035 RepID=A0A7C8HZU2_9PLEO|nr:mitochondrial import inner membrane translocase subunit Tim54 [Massariosphaeria phaeospora]
MATPDTQSLPTASGASNGPAKPPRAPNPVWTMMGLPNFRLKLPSRNWMIFLSITGSWTAAVVYDRRQKKRIQQKWARVVEHIALEPLDAQQLPRKVSVYISAPPADGLVAARDHFHEYVKPILVAAALDWDAVEGRREGDVRAGLAERIRKLRRKRGEQSLEVPEQELDDMVEEARKRAGVKEWDGPSGDIVIGRHTWKEYVRGLHEGWLGPLDSPAPAAESAVASIEIPTTATDGPVTGPSPPLPTDDASPTAAPELLPTEPEKPKEDGTKPKKKKQPPPFNSPADYHTSTLSANCPRALGPVAVIPFPHLLGFLNFPTRMYRFLNRRHVADDIGRQTAAAVLGTFRPFDIDAGGAFPSDPASSTSTSGAGDDASVTLPFEQQRLLQHEEPEWHKTVRERKDEDESPGLGTTVKKERLWLDDMVLDARIAERMRRFEVDAETEEKAKRNASRAGESWFASLWPRSGNEKKKLWEGLDDRDDK